MGTVEYLLQTRAAALKVIKFLRRHHPHKTRRFAIQRIQTKTTTQYLP